MNPAATITNHTQPAPTRCCLNPTPTCRVESETAHHPVSRVGCSGLDWVVDSGYDALQARLNADPNTTYTIPSATDVAHSQEAKAGTLPSDPASP